VEISPIVGLINWSLSTSLKFED